MRSWRFAKLAHVWLVVPAVGVVLAAQQTIRDNSFLWHIQAGHLQASAGRVLTEDPFSLVYGGQPWRTQSWLLELVFAALGDDLRWVELYLAMVGGVTMLAIAVAIFSLTRSIRWTAALVVFVELFAFPFLTPRPVVVSFMFLGLLLVVLRSERLRWTIPLLMWVWAAVHGSFMLGLGLIVLEGLAFRDRRRVVDALAGTVSVTLTAHGSHAWETVATFYRSSESLAYMTEWSRPELGSREVVPFLVLVAAVGAMFILRRIPIGQLWIALPFGVFGLSTTRAIMPAGLVLVACLAIGVGRVARGSEEASWPATLLVVGFVGFAVVSMWPGIARIDRERFPIDVAEALIDVPTFHDDVVGGYLIFRRLGPSRVFFDDRAELYPGEFVRSVIAARSGADEWELLFRAHDVEQALLRRTDNLSQVLARSPRWQEVAGDEEFGVWRLTAG
ncbi:MAG: hypothetical protein OEY98_06375 [Acidimicrobiia bacterium]|nr:hypothetical protein [Acidimicrobiia bacterium]